MAEIFKRIGTMAIVSRLRLLSQQLTDDASKLYQVYDIDGFSSKWFPVYFILHQDGKQTITQIAQSIGHSQPSVTKIIKEMAAAGLVKEHLKSKDKRKNVVGLTVKGMNISEQIINELSRDANTAIDQMIAQSQNNLWDAIEEWEQLLKQKSLLKRIQEQKKQRETKHIQIVPYQGAYKSIFKNLNQQWVSTYFEMEETDYKYLDHPEENIIEKGGQILVALYKDQPMGVCALAKMEDPEYDFELIKMAVSPEAQGKNIGYLLGKEAIRLAKELGATKLYLESNHVLKPAVNLYHKLGFVNISTRWSPYKRADVQMELVL